MNNIKVIIWGFGAMGRGIAETLLSKKGVEIVGICDVNPALKNKKLSEIIKQIMSAFTRLLSMSF